MTVRAKFRVLGVTAKEGGYEITLAPVTSHSPENEDFFHWTPYGSITIGTVNENAAQAFGSPGDQFYVDFTKAES